MARSVFSCRRGLVVLGFVLQAVAVDINLCSNINTGSHFSSVTNIYQTNGACSDTCRKDYAFAITQGKDCWCSNYFPSSTTAIDDCGDNCPGFPSEKCGSTANGLFGYVQLNIAPSGTQSGSSSATSSPDQSTQSTSPTSSSTSSTTSSSSSSTTLTTTTPSSPTVTSPTSTGSRSAIVSVMTVTGGLQTVTITPSDPPSTLATQQTQDNSFLNNAGKVAGLFVGLAVLILCTAAGVLFFCYRRRNPAMFGNGSTAVGSSPPRTRSRSMSELGLIGDDSTTMGSKSLPRLSTGMWGGMGVMGDSPTSPDRRSSNARIVDQRLDPGTLWNPLHENSSRISVRSLQDDRDYSRRVLKLANPD